MTKDVVILGGSIAGLAIAHRLLKHTLPSEPELKVTLVSQNSHFYWNCASVRAVVPGSIKNEDLLQPIKPGLTQYPTGSVEFILGSAVAVDRTGKTVEVATTSPGPRRSVPYSFLVIATGARSPSPGMPWKAAGTYEELVESLRATADAVGRAAHVTVAGAGATGVELAAEIRSAKGEKEVLLLCGDAALCAGDRSAPDIERELVKLGVCVRKNARADKVEEAGANKSRVILQGGETIETDLYLPTMGLVPNSEFLPQEWLTEKKYVDVGGDSQVKGEVGIWALGDVVSKPRASYPETEAQATGVAKNIALALKGQPQGPVKGMPFDVFLCSMGPSRGAGRLGWVKMPSLAVWFIKGRTLGTEKTKQYAQGTAF